MLEREVREGGEDVEGEEEQVKECVKEVEVLEDDGEVV